MSASSHNIFGMLNKLTFDPGISDQLTEISIMGMQNNLHKYTNSTSKHHLQDVKIGDLFNEGVTN